MEGPYTHVHVYRLDGRLTSCAAPEDPAFMGHWLEGDTSSLFFAAPADHAVARLLAAHPPLRVADHTAMTYEEWQGVIAPEERVGPFRVHPAWVPDRLRSKDPLTIVLDPGVVFGAGNHPTTRDCLLAIDRAAAERPFASALDLGTGTGILAIAAARRLNIPVVAVDSNPAAVTTAARNVARNGLTGQVLVLQGRAEAMVAGRAELLMANLHLPVLQRVMQAPGFRAKRGLILSGITAAEAVQVRQTLARLDIPLRHEWSADGTWHTFLAVASP